MKNLIIIGARGFGREYHNGLKLRDDYGKDFIIKGFWMIRRMHWMVLKIMLLF